MGNRYGPRAVWWSPLEQCQDELLVADLLRDYKEMRVTASDRGTIDIQTLEKKENSNMNTNNADRFSKNCAVKTLQIQLERAEENTKMSLRNVNYYQDQKHQYEKHENRLREILGADEKKVKELKAALKKLGAAPAAS